MKTVINNNERVFQVIDSRGNQYFCNLIDLEEVVTVNRLVAGYFKINHFWDNKPKRVSKAYLNELYQANFKGNAPFYY